MCNTGKGSSGLNLRALDFASFAAYTGYAAGTAVIPMTLLAMSASLGFSIGDGGMLHLLRSCAMLVTMLLAGMAAYRFGKIRMLGLALLLMAAGLYFCGIAGSFIFLTVGVVITGFGNGFFESLLTSSVEDRHPAAAEASRCINLTHSFWSLGIVAMALCSGYWLQKGVDWQKILSGIAIFLLLVAAVFLLNSSKDPVKREHSVKAEMWSLLKDRRFRWFLLALFLAGGGEHALTFWTPGFMELEFGAGHTMCGAAAGCFAGGMFCGRFLSGIFLRKRLSGVITGCALLGMVVSFLVPGMKSLWGVMILLFVLGVAAGPLWPSLQFYCAKIMQRSESTAVYILMPLVGIPGCGFFTWLLGIISEHCGMKTGFYLVPLCNCGIWIIMLIISKFEHKEKA